MKGQSSVELLIILAVSMTAIGLIIAASSNEITSINSAKAKSDAQNAVNKITSASEEVFVSGPGTKKQIYVSIPSGVDETKTSVGNKTIRLNVNGTDIISESNVEVTGSIPTEAGNHLIWITAYSGYVVIGDIQVETDKGSIYSAIAQNASITESIKVINNTSGNVNVNASYNWNSADVSLQLSASSFIVPAGLNSGIDLNFTSNSTATGNYSGELIFDVNTVEGIKQMIIPLTIEVISGGTGTQNLIIFPDYWNASINAGDSSSGNFQVCNASSTALTNIEFTASEGDAGNWVQSIPAITSLSENTCRQITVIVNVPLGETGNTGTVTASDGSNSDFISLNITVPFNDITPPIIMLEFPSNNYVSGSFTVQFDYNAFDFDSGIAFCSLIIDGITDQTDNTITEGITQSFIKTFSSNAVYSWDINCTDDSFNVNQGTSGENRIIAINAVQYPIIIAFHDFPDLSWSSGTGWINAWVHSGDSSIRSNGVPNSSPYHLRLRRNSGYAARAVDLSSYNKPRLEFWAKANSFEAGDTAILSVSSDGFIWSVIKTFTSADSDNSYHFYEFDLNAFALSSQFWIAFNAEMGDRTDYFYVDDINIVQRTP